VRRGCADRLEDSRGLEQHRDAVGIVGCAERGMPRIEVGACHHDLFTQLRIASRNLGDDVVAIRVRRGKPRFHVNAQRHRNPILQQPGDHVVVLCGEDDVGRTRWRRVPTALQE
jgi:hypothetical protein